MKHFPILALLGLFFFACQSSKNNNPEIVFPGTANPIPDKEIIPNIPFWNAYAKIFIYAPAFDFEAFENASEYSYALTTSLNEEFTFTDNQPNAALSPIWELIPEGIVELEVHALNDDGEILGLAGKKKMYRAASFSGVHNSPDKPYSQVAYDALKYLYQLPHMQKWMDSDKPDLHYSLYGYPSKIVASLAEGMLVFSAMSQTEKSDSINAMKMVLNMMHHLDNISSSEHELLKEFVPTYDLDFVAQRLKNPDIEDENGVNGVATKNANKLMMVYGYTYADVLLKVYARTQNKKYLQKAISIAEAYKALQLPDGNWNLNIHFHSAEPMDNAMLMPTNLLVFLKKMQDKYGVVGFDEVIAKGEEWMKNNPMKTFFWEAQFEDVPTYKEKYHSLSKYPPSDYAMYLLNKNASAENIAIAKELVRFCEDQFVVWNNPPNDSILFNQWASKDTVKWHTPCVLEQYHFYVPVDASACQMINAYTALYKSTNEEIFLQKATALANSITEVQQENGEITTVWTKSGFETENWLNCMVMSAKTLLQFDELTGE